MFHRKDIEIDLFGGASLKKISQTKRHLVSLFFSVMTHGILGLLFLDIKMPVFEVPKIEMNPEKLARTRIQLDEIKFVKPDVVKKYRENIERKNRQIVSTEKNGENIKPQSSRFLGEKDQSFARQTIAKRNGSFKEMGLGSKNGSLAGKELLNNTPKKMMKSGSSAPSLAKASKDLNWGDLAIGLKSHSIGEAKEINDKKVAESKPEDQELDKMIESSNEEALGSSNGTRHKVGLAQNNDFVEEIPLGEMTQLNTQEFKYFGFYNRIKLQLEQFWGKSINDKARALYRSGRRMPASENMITSVTVVLDEKGQIVNIKIDGSSGVRELDHAAVESFKKAGPFPNPPKGLVVDGRAVIQWGFVVRS